MTEGLMYGRKVLYHRARAPTQTFLANEITEINLIGRELPDKGWQFGSPV